MFEPPRDRQPLWKQVPRSLWVDLVPVITTAFLVESGKQTAEVMTRLREGKPFNQPVSPNAVTDLTWVFIFVNFVVVIGFSYHSLKQSVAKDENISLSAQAVGLATIFLTSLKVYSFAIETGQPERIVFALPVLFYLVIVPFFLMRTLPLPAAPDDTTGVQAAPQALAALELVFYALVPCIVTVVACSLYFVLIEEGVELAGRTVVPPLVPVNGQRGGMAFWGFNPGYLGIGWLPAILMIAVASRSRPSRFILGLGRGARIAVAVGSVLIAVPLALALMADDSLSLTAGTSARARWLVKAVLASAVMLAFLAAAAVALRLDRALRAPWMRWTIQAAAFALVLCHVCFAGFSLVLMAEGIRSPGHGQALPCHSDG